MIRLHCAIQCAAAETKFYCAINLCRRSITSRQIIHREFGLQYLFSTQLTSCINSFRFCVFFTWPSSCDWSSNDEFIFYILLTTTIKWSDKHKGSFSVSLQGNSLCLLLKKGPLDRTNEHLSVYKHHYIDIHRDIRVELQGEGAEESTDWLSNEEPDQVNLYSLFFSSPPWESLEFIYCLCENPVVEILWPRRVINEGSQWEVRSQGTVYSHVIV